MATFYYNRHSGEDINSQWTKHIQTSAYINDIGGIVSQNRRDLENAIEHSSKDQVNAIRQVCGKLDEGFAEVANYLSDIDFNISGLRAEINAMSSMLDWKLSLLIEEQRLSNQLLGHIAQLLRIPDSQKQRVYYIEQGLKYLKNAILEGASSSFYSDAIESFRSAEKIEKKDYITLNRIGQIFLYSKNHLNIPLAEDYFLLSARESFAEYNAGGTIVSTILIPLGIQFQGTEQNLNNYQSSNNQVGKSFNSFLVSTSESYLFAGRTSYLQQNYSRAAELAGKAYNLIPEFLEAGYEQAKYLAANNQEVEAEKILEVIIKKDRYYSLKVLSDQDLATKPTILNLLEKFQRNALETAKQRLKECKDIMITRSLAGEIIGNTETYISRNSFLSGMRALDFLDADYQLPCKINKAGYETIGRKSITPKLKIIDFLNKEKESEVELEYLKKKVKSEIINNSVKGFTFWGLIIGFFIGFFRGCTVKEFSMEWDKLFFTMIVIGAIAALFGYAIGIGKEPTILDNPAFMDK
jgi:hypothetical protein